jgi:hypothetical protein
MARIIPPSPQKRNGYFFIAPGYLVNGIQVASVQRRVIDAAPHGRAYAAVHHLMNGAMQQPAMMHRIITRYIALR